MDNGERRCARCDVLLSRYNDGSICGPCAVAARGDLDIQLLIPPELWFTPEMRMALSRWDWATVLTRVSSATGATQGQLSTVVSLSQAHVSRLMTNNSQCFDIRTIMKIVDGLGAPRMLAGLAPAFNDLPSTVELDTPDTEASAMKRRSLLETAAAAPFAAILGACGPQVVLKDAERLRAMVPQLFTLDDQIGGLAVSEIASSCMRQVDHLLNNAKYDSNTERVLQIAYGELAEMSGWLNFDSGRYERAQLDYGEALRAAQLAEDLNLEVLVLASMNTLARYRGRPKEAIQLVQLADRRARGWAPPRLMSLLAAREAQCWAQLNDREASAAAMRRAFNVFNPAIDPSDPAWISFFDAAELEARQATASSYFGKSEKSARHMRAAVDGLGAKFQRNRAYYSVRLGLAHLSAGDEKEACAAVRAVLPMFGEVKCGRAHVRLRQFCKAIETSRRPPARDVLDYAQHLNVAWQAA